MADYQGTSIVDYLKSTGQDASFASRAKLAGQYGITSYSGTAGQNTQLLNTLRGAPAGQAAAPQTTAQLNSVLNTNQQTYLQQEQQSSAPEVRGGGSFD